MTTPQGGIFALGTASHAYLEFDARAGRDSAAFVRAISSLREPRTTMGGVNLVAGFRPELWQTVAADDAPAGVEGFDHDLIGADGYVMPATQHDAVLWLSGSAYDVIFDMAREAVTELEGLASVAEETSSWPYRHDRDLTGFIDGTENPSLIDAPDVALIPEGRPGAVGPSCCSRSGPTTPARGSPCPSLSRSGHGTEEARQPRARGQGALVPRGEHRPRSFRQDLPAKHALRNRHEPRHDVRGVQRGPTATPAMLESMAGLQDGVRDALTLYTRPLTGAYYFVPSTEGLRRLFTESA